MSPPSQPSSSDHEAAPADQQQPQAASIDHSAFPHIIGSIVGYALEDHHSTLLLRGVCREFRDQIDSIQLAHVVLSTGVAVNRTEAALVSRDGRRIPVLASVIVRHTEYYPDWKESTVPVESRMKMESTAYRSLPRIGTLDLTPGQEEPSWALDAVVDTVRVLPLPTTEEMPLYASVPLKWLPIPPRRVTVLDPTFDIGSWGILSSCRTTLELYVDTVQQGISLLDYGANSNFWTKKTSIVYTNSQGLDELILQDILVRMGNFLAQTHMYNVVLAGFNLTAHLWTTVCETLLAQYFTSDALRDEDLAARRDDIATRMKELQLLTLEEHMAGLSSEDKRLLQPSVQ